MTAAYQAFGAVGIVVGLLGTWLAARHRSGWLVCVASSTMWFPTLITGTQWVAVANCFLSIGICVRNFRAQRVGSRGDGPVEAGHAASTPAGELVLEGAAVR